MVAVINNENRNALAAKVASGEVSFEKAITGLTQAEVKIFYRKLDKVYQVRHMKSLQSVFGMPFVVKSKQPDKDFRFPKEPFGPFRFAVSPFPKKSSGHSKSARNMVSW